MPLLVTHKTEARRLSRLGRTLPLPMLKGICPPLLQSTPAAAAKPKAALTPAEKAAAAKAAANAKSAAAFVPRLPLFCSSKGFLRPLLNQ